MLEEKDREIKKLYEQWESYVEQRSSDVRT
jgi:hypothetical protein